MNPVDGQRLHNQSFVLDLHTHGQRFIPQPFRSMWRAVTPAAPAETGLGVLPEGGVNAVVASAVGDPVVTRCYLGRSEWSAVEAQLAEIERQAAEAGAAVVGSTESLAQAKAHQTPAVLLGVEGADAIGRDVDRIDAWHERGIRVITLLHLGDNTVGTTCLPWQHYIGPLPSRRRTPPGLSSFGRRVVERMNRVGVLVDVAHCDRATVLDIVDACTAPVVSSHSGARAVRDFPRYLSDQELHAIAATGGLVGLWPYRTRHTGVRDLAELIAHARHIADTIGPEHLAIGTDTNGVPGVMDGYRGQTDLPKLTCALLHSGFDQREVTGILGQNAVRVLGQVEEHAHRTS